MRHDKSKSVVFLQISFGALLLDLFISQSRFSANFFLPRENRHHR